ncbi:hypothetical protein RRG08_032298 [Elysia crispata]|uniref:Uncharacterized protein n=1 Tax=Elysia crispata TaxID=231223 RepID=A0AAE1E3A4_9GAST|nr:hypothetical protein RRG08_032298 [Elysia crispata]
MKFLSSDEDLRDIVPRSLGSLPHMSSFTNGYVAQRASSIWDYFWGSITKSFQCPGQLLGMWHKELPMSWSTTGDVAQRAFNVLVCWSRCKTKSFQSPGSLLGMYHKH